MERHDQCALGQGSTKGSNRRASSGLERRELIASFTKKDFRVDTFRGSGAGGQHRNKTDSCVRITHIDTGLVGYSCEYKEQGRNKALAFKRLAEKVLASYKAPKERILHAPSGTAVRTYNKSRSSVKDSRIDRHFDYEDVLHGDGLSMIHAKLKHMDG